MGREINQLAFSAQDRRRFDEKLRLETRLLQSYVDDGHYAPDEGTCGLELEAWLVDRDLNPAPENQRFISNLDDPLIVPELARFNFEINTLPQALDRKTLSSIHRSLQQQWQACQQCAAGMGLQAVQIGILPTLKDNQLTMNMVSSQRRYLALNEQILRSRQQQPLLIDIEGEIDHLQLVHRDVMAESATTSLQIHLQLSPDNAVRFYNASLIASALTAAACANSPYLFGKRLWQETRIPLFEQAVAVPCFVSNDGRVINRASFGSDYLHQSVSELFIENLEHYSPLLPLVEDSDNPFSHLQLHNGTIWRWNRPLISLDNQGRLQLRIEHRVPAAGPSVEDNVANIAFYIGTVYWLAGMKVAPELTLAHASAERNFYLAARYGLNAKVDWLNKTQAGIQSLLLDQVIPGCKASLLQLGLDSADIEHYLGIVFSKRIASGQTGSQWQTDFIEQHPAQFAAMLDAYICHQESGAVYQWSH